MPIVSATPAGGDVPPRAKSARKSASTKAQGKKTPGGGKPGRRKFDDADARQEVAFTFGVEAARGRPDWDHWRAEVRIVDVEEWAVVSAEASRTGASRWAATGLDDGRVMLARLIPPQPAKVYNASHHYPPGMKAVRGFRSRLLDWLESQPDVGADPEVVLHGEGACTITFGAPDDEGGREAVDLVLSRNEHLGPWD